MVASYASLLEVGGNMAGRTSLQSGRSGCRMFKGGGGMRFSHGLSNRGGLSVLSAEKDRGEDGEGEGGDSYRFGGDDESSSKGICRSLETSFRRVWLRLFTTGADENYVAELKEFVLGAMAAYDAGYSQPALILELGRHELETGDPNVDKTVRLTDQERQTREVWLVLVYLTLHRLRYKLASGDIPQPPSDSLGLSALVVSTCEAFDAGFSLEGLRLELTVSAGDAPPVLTPAQLALRSQWTRIVFITCQLVNGRKKKRT